MKVKAPATRPVVFESWALRLVRPGNVSVVVIATHGHLDAMRAGAAGAIGVNARAASLDIAGKLWMQDQKAVLSRITDLVNQDEPSDLVACYKNDIDTIHRIEDEEKEKKTKKMKI